MLTEGAKPGIGGVPLPHTKPHKYPSLYARGEVAELPAWIAFDKQVCNLNINIISMSTIN